MTFSKELLLKAIEAYTLYHPNQKQLLKVLIKLELDGIIVISPLELATMVGCSVPTIYRLIGFLKKEKVIDCASPNRIKSIKLNISSLEPIIRSYEKRISLI